jgi:uncharacterized cupin superfamily protein
VVDASVGARADDAIGVASVVRNNVSGALPSGDVKINIGESVIRNEIVKTAEDSSTKLVFVDSTNLSIGPKATVRLSNFVAASPSTYGKATIDVAKGAFRFATGHSDKRAYEINTGVATIGVRGTVFEADAEGNTTKLRVVNGAVRVRAKNGKVCEIKAGESAVITLNACAVVVGYAPSFQFFEAQCATSPTLCAPQEFSELAPGQQGFFSLDNPSAFLIPGAAAGGAMAGGAALGLSTQPHPGDNTATYQLLLNSANTSKTSRPASP